MSRDHLSHGRSSCPLSLSCPCLQNALTVTGTLVKFVVWNCTGSDQRSRRADDFCLVICSESIQPARCYLIAVHKAEHLESHAQPGGLTHVRAPDSPSAKARTLPTNRKPDNKGQRR